nr:50S ribosomal protein L27, chloroplastic [Ipomoea batatas]
MATQQKGEDDQHALHVDMQGTGSSSSSLVGRIQEQYSKIKENAETYPYVWGSYIVVYGGFGLWFAYRWRKLRKTEDRVRGLQEQLRKLVESQEPGSSSGGGLAQWSREARAGGGVRPPAVRLVGSSLQHDHGRPQSGGKGLALGSIGLRLLRCGWPGWSMPRHGSGFLPVKLAHVAYTWRLAQAGRGTYVRGWWRGGTFGIVYVDDVVGLRCSIRRGCSPFERQLDLTITTLLA